MATIRKRGEYQWEVQIRKRGYPSQTKTFNTKAEAEAWAAVIESEMVRGVFVSRAEAESTTLAKALTRYATEIAPKKKGATQELNRIKHVKTHPLASRFLAAIRGTDIASYRDELLAAGYAPASVARELAVLSHLFNIARREWGMESLTNPVQLIRRPSINNERERRIRRAPVWMEEDGELVSRELDELDMISRVTESPDLPCILTVAVETAMRRGEIVGLERKHVDLERRVAHLPDTKNGSARDVPLSSRAVGALQSQLARSNHTDEPDDEDGGDEEDDRVFTLTDDAVTRAFIRAVKRARGAYEKGLRQALRQEGQPEKKIQQTLAADPFLTDLHFHDLRHEATSRLADILPLHELAKITGHKDTRMLMRYYHPRAEDLAKKLN